MCSWSHWVILSDLNCETVILRKVRPNPREEVVIPHMLHKRMTMISRCGIFVNSTVAVCIKNVERNETKLLSQ